MPNSPAHPMDLDCENSCSDDAAGEDSSTVEGSYHSSDDFTEDVDFDCEVVPTNGSGGAESPAHSLGHEATACTTSTAEVAAAPKEVLPQLSAHSYTAACDMSSFLQHFGTLRVYSA